MKQSKKVSFEIPKKFDLMKRNFQAFMNELFIIFVISRNKNINSYFEIFIFLSKEKDFPQRER